MQLFNVASKSGTGTHQVAFDGDEFDCDCEGFRFRKKCRHTQIVQELILAEGQQVTDHASIHEAMAAAYLDCDYVQKKKAQGLSYSFAGESAIIDEVRPAMVRHGIYAYPMEISELQRDTYTTKNGSMMNSVSMMVKYRFAHSSGTSIDVEAYGEGADSGDKAAPKAMTGAFKYALRQAFVIETGDDPDNTPSDQQERAAPPRRAANVPATGSPPANAPQPDDSPPANNVESDTTDDPVDGLEKKREAIKDAMRSQQIPVQFFMRAMGKEDPGDPDLRKEWWLQYSRADLGKWLDSNPDKDWADLVQIAGDLKDAEVVPQ